MKKIITIITSLILLATSPLYSKQLYVWVDKEEHKLFCFDRETETLIDHSLTKKHYPYSRFHGLIYVSNFIIADYNYFPDMEGQKNVKDYRFRGGFAIIDVRDGSYREIEASDLVDGYFSTTGCNRDITGTLFLFSLVNIEDAGVSTDENEMDYFKWNPNSSASPIEISTDEYGNLFDRSVSKSKRVKEISTTNTISETYTDKDYIFIYDNKMMAWANEEDRFYVLRDNLETDFKKVILMSVDGLRSVNVAR